MIKGINSSSIWLTVTGGNGGVNYINNYSGAQGVGNMRYNTASQNLEIWDGNNWVLLSTTYATVDISAKTKQILEWCEKKMQEEIVLENLAEKYPAIKDLQDQLAATVKLCQETENDYKP